MFLRNPQKEAEDKIGYFCGLLIGHLPAGRSDGIDLSMLDFSLAESEFVQMWLASHRHRNPLVQYQ